MRKANRVAAALSAMTVLGTTPMVESIHPLEFSTLFAFWLGELDDPVALCSLGEPEAIPCEVELEMSERTQELTSQRPIPFAPLRVPE
jgi:hypothetical protein